MSEKKPDFEQALARLETLVDEMENKPLPLDQLIRHFEEGSKLATLCSQRLNEVEQKIRKLVRKDGELTTEPLDTDSGE